jgi:hypothetical protein
VIGEVAFTCVAVPHDVQILVVQSIEFTVVPACVWIVMTVLRSAFNSVLVNVEDPVAGDIVAVTNVSALVDNPFVVKSRDT